jgi:ABC-type iron transport system FetAB ATPase subunit
MGLFGERAMDDFWEGKERHRELLAQIALAIEALGKNHLVVGPSGCAEQAWRREIVPDR